MKIYMAVLLILIFSFSITYGQIEGLIIDKTRTKIGHDFYELFYINLEQMPKADSFNIVVEEFVDPQFGSRVMVSINDNIVYQNFVSSRYDDIEQKAKEASDTVSYFLINWKEYKKFLEEEGKIR